MTVVVAWRENDAIWVAADTRFSRPGTITDAQIITDHGPKIFILPLVVYTRNETGYFDVISLCTSIGFAFAGVVAPALSTQSLCSLVLQNLNSFQELPSLEEIVEFVRFEAERYMRDWAQGHPSGAEFAAIVFGRCPVSNKLDAYEITPIRDAASFSVSVSLLDLEDPKAIGSGSQEFNRLYGVLRKDGDAHARTARLPLIALEQTIDTKKMLDVGGAVQLARADTAGVRLFARVSPIVLGRPEAKMQFLGIDFQDLKNIGNCWFGMPGLA